MDEHLDPEPVGIAIGDPAPPPIVDPEQPVLVNASGHPRPGHNRTPEGNTP